MTEETKPIVFIDQETLQGFQALVTEDPMVHIPGVYSGQLSAITPAVAAGLVKRKSNLLKAKVAPEEVKELAKAEKAEAKAEAKADRTEAKDLPREEAKKFPDPKK